MSHLVLNCRDLEHRNKALKRITTELGIPSNVEPDERTDELQVYLMLTGSKISTDRVASTHAHNTVTLKIEHFIREAKARIKARNSGSTV